MNDAFYQYKQTLFQDQDKINPDFIRTTALAAGIDASELTTCTSDPSTHEAIIKQINEGQAAGVRGTPALFINGRFSEMGANPKFLAAVIDALLEKKQ